MNNEDFHDIIYKKENSGICTITLNRPERKNALSHQTFLEIERVLADMEKDPNSRVLIITGCKKSSAFSSGGYLDLKFIKNISLEKNQKLKSEKKRISFWNFSKPVIAAINGYAIGAGFTMILLGADLIYIAENAWISFNFVRRGIITQSAMSFILPLYLGFQKAKELLYFGDKITAQEAEKLGLVNKVLPAEELLPYTYKVAKRLIPPNAPSISIKLMKKTIHEHFREIILQTHELEKKGNKTAFKTHDFREAIRAFKEGRAPQFKGK